MKESMMSGFWGKALIAGVTLVVAFLGIKFVQPKISAGNGNILEILKEFRGLIAMMAGVLCVPICGLVYTKIQASRQKNRAEAEIKKAELENEKIKLQNEQLELQNRQLELQKENQQSLPERKEKSDESNS